MNKNERKYLYELIKKFLEVDPRFNDDERHCGLSILYTIQQCDENKTIYNKMIKDLEEMMQERKEEQEKMKSRVALDHLQSLDLDAMENEAVNWGWYYDNKPKAGSVREDLAIIEQDLEILEIIKQKAKGNRFFKGCLLRMFQEDGEKKTYLDNPPRKIEKNYYKIKEWLENDKQ